MSSRHYNTAFFQLTGNDGSDQAGNHGDTGLIPEFGIVSPQF